jgi:DNA-binding XRE family transcriptional regulator
MPTEDECEKTKVTISLRAARISSGYTSEESAKHLNISPETLCEYERDAGEMPVSMAIVILRLYGFHVDIIHFGRESEFVESRNRN